MEAIKGSDVNVPDAVFAWMLDGRGGVKPLENTDVIDEAHPCWLHLNYVHHDSANGWRQHRCFPITYVMRWRARAHGPESAVSVKARLLHCAV